MIHYGIRLQDGEWFTFTGGSLFQTTSLAVANAQLALVKKYGFVGRVAEFRATGPGPVCPSCGRKTLGTQEPTTCNDY